MSSIQIFFSFKNIQNLFYSINSEFELIIRSPNEHIAQHQEYTLEAKVVMAEKVVADHVIATDPVIVADTDLDPDHEVVIIVIDLLRHIEDDHHHHTNAKEDLALKKSGLTFQSKN